MQQSNYTQPTIESFDAFHFTPRWKPTPSPLPMSLREPHLRLLNLIALTTAKTVDATSIEKVKGRAKLFLEGLAQFPNYSERAPHALSEDARAVLASLDGISASIRMLAPQVKKDATKLGEVQQHLLAAELNFCGATPADKIYHLLQLGLGRSLDQLGLKELREELGQEQGVRIERKEDWATKVSSVWLLLSDPVFQKKFAALLK